MASDILTVPDCERLMAAVDATWPAAEVVEVGGWRLRRGAGGGKRVSAASPLGRGGGTVGEAEAAMRGWGQAPLFRLTPADADCDAGLAARGYRIVDPVVLYAGPVAGLAGDQSHEAALYRAAFATAIMEEIWAAGQIGPGRLAVMERVGRPSVRLLSRAADTPCGAAFVGVDGEVAMIHAIEVL